jgi:hypothetical protein
MVVSFTTSPLYPEEKALRTYWIGGCAGPRAGLEGVEKRKNLFPLPLIEPQPVQSVAHRIKRQAFVKKSDSDQLNYESVSFRTLLAACFMLVSCLAYPSSPKMDAIYSFETLVELHWTTWRYILENKDS